MVNVESKVKALYRPAVEAYVKSLDGYHDTREVSPHTRPAYSYPNQVVPQTTSAYGYLVGHGGPEGNLVVIEPPAVDDTGGGKILLNLDYYTFEEMEP